MYDGDGEVCGTYAAALDTIPNSAATSSKFTCDRKRNSVVRLRCCCWRGNATGGIDDRGFAYLAGGRVPDATQQELELLLGVERRHFGGIGFVRWCCVYCLGGSAGLLLPEGARLGREKRLGKPTNVNTRVSRA